MALRIGLLILSVCLKTQLLVTGDYYDGDIDSVMEVWSQMLGRFDDGDDITEQFKTLTLRVKDLVDRGLILPMGEETIWKHNLYLMKYCIPGSHYAGTSMHDLPSQVHAQEYSDYMHSNLKGVDKQSEDFITQQHQKFAEQEERNYREASEDNGRYEGLYYRPSRSSYQNPLGTEDYNSDYLKIERTTSYSDSFTRSQSSPSFHFPDYYGNSYGTTQTPPSYQDASYSELPIDSYYRTPSTPTADEIYEDAVQDTRSFSTRSTSPSQYGGSDKFLSCHQMNVETPADPQSPEEAPAEERKHRWRRHHRHHHLSSLFGNRNE